MKQLFIILTMLVFLGCNDDSLNLKSENLKTISPKTLSNVNLSKIVSIRNLTTHEQKVAYELLNQNERYTLWFNQIENHIKMTKYNAEQKKIIQELFNNISIEIFSSAQKNDTKEIFFTEFFRPWVKKAAKILSPAYLDALVFSINSDEINQDAGKSPSLNSNSIEYLLTRSSDCSCNVGSSFTCLTYSAECNCNAYLDCTQQSCSNPSTLGCGAFLAYSCNGMCDGNSWGE